MLIHTAHHSAAAQAAKRIRKREAQADRNRLRNSQHKHFCDICQTKWVCNIPESCTSGPGTLVRCPACFKKKGIF